MNLHRAMPVMLGVCLFLWAVLPTVRSQSATPPRQRAIAPQNGSQQTSDATVAALMSQAPGLPPEVHLPPGLQSNLARASAKPSADLPDGMAHPFDADPMDSSNPTFFTTATYGSGGYHTSAVAIADVNGDDIPDLIAANNGTVTILLGNGDGTFQPAVSFNSGGNSDCVVAGDVNGDGNADLGGGDRDGSGAVLMGRGNGNFQTATRCYPSGGNTNAAVAITDVNADGKPDIVVTNYCESNDSNCTNGVVIVLLNEGGGTCQQTQTYSSGGYWTLAVMVGDFNGDGKSDLAVVNYCADSSCASDGTISILLGNGDGTFQPAVSYDAGGTPYAVAIGDVNGDGSLDLVVAGLPNSKSNFPEGVVGILLGNGNGTFQAPVEHDSGGSLADSIAVQDVNGDGKLDVVVANNCGLNSCGVGLVDVLIGNGDGTFQAALGYGSAGADSNFVVIGDVNGDGALDIVVSNKCEVIDANCTDGSIGVLLNNGSGNFVPPSYSTGGFYVYSVAVGDFNRDGNADLAVTNLCTAAVCTTNSGISVLLGNSDGTFQSAINYDPGDPANSIAVADLNGDGNPDLVVASYGNSVSVLLGNGDGTFQVPVPYSLGGQAISVVIADVNGDGIPDLLVATRFDNNSNGNQGAVDVLIGNGDGTFQQPLPYNSGAYDSESLAVGDVNGDGKPDLILSMLGVDPDHCTNGIISVFLGNGDGTFQPPATFNSGGRNAFSLALGDFNGDRKLDLAVSNLCASGSGLCTSSSLSVFLGNGDGTFQSPVSSSVPIPQSSGQLLALADYNGDGKLDIAFAGGSLLLGNGDGTFQTATTLGLSGTGISSGDFNHDGKPDLAIAEGGSVSILQNIASNFLYATTVRVKPSANPTPANQPVTFTATVTPGFNAGAPTGSVTFSDGGNPLGMGTISGGAAAFPTSSLSPGWHSITAAYSGDSNYASSVSAALSETINSVSSATTTTIAASPNPSTYGRSVSLTATVTSAGSGTPTGSVTFMDGANNLGSGTVSGGMDMLITAALGVGSHSITANYSGDSNFSASTSSALTVVVNQATSTVGISSSVNPSSYNQPVTFTAAITAQYGGTATGTATFKDGSASIGSAVVSANAASLTLSTLTGGTHSITAVYSGDGNVLGSSSSAVSQVVSKQASTSAVTSSANPAIAGSSITFTITVSPQLSSTPTGSVALKKNGGTLATLSLTNAQATYTTSSLGIGSFSITALYAGDSNFSANTSPVLTQVVGKASTTTAVTSSLNPSNVGQSVTFTATVSSSSGPPPDGEVVAFKSGGATVGSGGLSGGIAVFSTSTLTAGAQSITAVYSGDATFSASTSATLTQTVSKYGTTLTLASSGNPSSVGQPVIFTATVNSSGGVPPNGEIVTFKNGGATLGTGSLSAGVATFSTSSLAAGSHSVSAVYSGDATFLASTSATLPQMVDKYSTTSVVMSNDASTNYGQLVTFTATVTSNSGPTPTGTVVFKNGAATLGTQTLSGGTAMLSNTALAVGTRMITVVYNGDANNAGSTSTAISQVVAKAATSTTLTSSGSPSTFRSPVTFTATVSSSTTGTPTGSVTF